MKAPTQSFSLETFILEVIAFLGEQEGMLQQLSFESGLLPAQFYQDLGQPEIQAGIVDFLLSNEAILLKLCEAKQITPQEIWKMRLKLPGAPA